MAGRDARPDARPTDARRRRARPHVPRSRAAILQCLLVGTPRTADRPVSHVLCLNAMPPPPSVLYASCEHTDIICATLTALRARCNLSRSTHKLQI